jgi:hypothetical protein
LKSPCASSPSRITTMASDRCPHPPHPPTSDCLG